jgi:hypothetical protein
LERGKRGILPDFFLGANSALTALEVLFPLLVANSASQEAVYSVPNYYSLSLFNTRNKAKCLFSADGNTNVNSSCVITFYVRWLLLMSAGKLPSHGYCVRIVFRGLQVE